MALTIPEGVTNIGNFAFADCTGLTTLTISKGVTSIGDGAFSDCTALTTVTISSSVTNIGNWAFSDCARLRGIYFEGNAPEVGESAFAGGTIYYLPGTTGWGPTLVDRPTALWLRPNPVILTTAPGFGIETNVFGFTISWATNAAVVIEASADLGRGPWSPLATNALPRGALYWSYFSDPEWTKYPRRFYRIRAQ